MYTNADMTLYSKGSDGKYTRIPINGVFWNEVKEANTNKSGLSNSDSVKIFVPLTSKHNLVVATSDLVVKGICEYEIDNTSSSSISSSLSNLKKTYAFVTVSSCDAKLFGSKKMQHYVLSCK